MIRSSSQWLNTILGTTSAGRVMFGVILGSWPRRSCPRPEAEMQDCFESLRSLPDERQPLRNLIENQTSPVDKQIKLAKSFPFGTLLAQFWNVASSDLSTKEDARDATSNPVTFRIVWCRRRRAKAQSNLEVEAWRAEEDRVRDAAPRRNHVHKHRVDLPSYSNGMCWASKTGKRLCMSRG